MEKMMYTIGIVTIAALFMMAYGAITDPESATSVGLFANTYLVPLKGAILLPLVAVAGYLTICSLSNVFRR